MVATSNYSAIIDNNGRVFVAGKSPIRSSYKRQGDSFTRVKEFKDSIISLATSKYHMVAVDEKGCLWSVGSNEDGCSGAGNNVRYVMVPNLCIEKQLDTNLRFKSVCAGKRFSAALDVNGNVWTFGSNINGELGLGDDKITHAIVPTINSHLNNIKQIDACYMLLVALDVNGVIWVSGKIIGSDSRNFTPIPLNNNNRMRVICSSIKEHVKNNVIITKVACGKNHVLLLDHKGILRSFGDNHQWQCGYSNRNSSTTYPYRNIRQVVFDVNIFNDNDDVDNDDDDNDDDDNDDDDDENSIKGNNVHCEYHEDQDSDEPCTCVIICDCDSSYDNCNELTQDFNTYDDITNNYYCINKSNSGKTADNLREKGDTIDNGLECSCKSELGCPCIDYENSINITNIKDIYCSGTYSIVVDSLSCFWLMGYFDEHHQTIARPQKLGKLSSSGPKQILFVGNYHLLLKDDDGVIYAFGNNSGGVMGITETIRSVLLYPLPDFHLGFTMSQSVKSCKSSMVINSEHQSTHSYKETVSQDLSYAKLGKRILRDNRIPSGKRSKQSCPKSYNIIL